MIVQCSTCQLHFDDAFRTWVCPHRTFPANDGQNHFAHHPDSYLETRPGDGDASGALPSMTDQPTFRRRIVRWATFPLVIVAVVLLMVGFLGEALMERLPR